MGVALNFSSVMENVYIYWQTSTTTRKIYLISEFCINTWDYFWFFGSQYGHYYYAMDKDQVGEKKAVFLSKKKKNPARLLYMFLYTH